MKITIRTPQMNAKNKMAYEMYRNYGFTEKSINMELK